MKSKALIILAMITLTACQAKSPGLTTRFQMPLPPPPPPQMVEKTFEFATTESDGEQGQYDKNTITVDFQVLNKDGFSVNDVKAEELKVFENKVSVNPFTLTADQRKADQIVDIVFLVDITGTMVELIESAKERIDNFIRTSKERGYHTRMCLSTFGDYTVKRCFFRDTSSAKQLKQLRSELEKIQACRGKNCDPGYPDLDENPMRALVDASRADWAKDSQRFVVLVTDWGFLYSPDNKGKQFELGMRQNGKAPQAPPTMKEVNDAIRTAGMKVFAVTRTRHEHKGEQLSWDGYNTPFQGEPGIVQSSGGEYFDFNKFLTGEVTITDILERILQRIDTTYTLTYVVDDIQGLKVSLPVKQRDVQIQLDSSRGGVQIGSVMSSMPSGREEYKQSWNIADSPVDSSSVKVFINDQTVNPAEYVISGGTVSFKSPPPPGAKLRFEFLYRDLEKNLIMEPMTFTGALNANNTKVELNGKPARQDDVFFQRHSDGNTSLQLSEDIAGSNDPYGIRQKKSLTIKVTTTP